MDPDVLPLELRGLGPARLAALRALSAGVLGTYRLVMGERLEVGDDVVANHRLIVKGPGRVRLGDRANVFAVGWGRPTRLVTRAADAVIDVGENVRLNGADVQATTSVRIGRDCIVGLAHILDSDMHSLSPARRYDPDAPVRSAPVVLEPNVWVARGAAILPGVRVGEGSVVAYGAVVTEDVPAGVLVAGNPAKVVRELS
jgi:acetyltransferase-like isoleucine patch superfamily enzyme